MKDIENSELENDLTIRIALRSLRDELYNLYGDDAPTILIYGSYARGGSSPTSDVDVLLVYSYEIKPGAEIKRLSQILSDLNLQYQVLISLLPVVDKDYQQSEEVFWQNIRREGVPIDAF